MDRYLPALALVVALALAVACGGDDGSDDPEATPTPFIRDEPISTEDAIAELDSIIEIIRNPDSDAVDDTSVSQSELQTRIDETISGTAQVLGLEQVRGHLEAEERILAGEFLHNNLVERLAPPFGESDSTEISAEEMGELDPLGVFVPRGQPLEVSSIFEDAVRRIITLWYEL